MDEINLVVWRLSYKLVDLRTRETVGKKETLVYNFDKFAEMKEVSANLVKHYEGLGYKVVFLKAVEFYEISAPLSSLIENYEVRY